MESISNNEILFEHRFWLQILGDHSRFILSALSPQEEVLIQKSKNFITLFDRLLDMARKESSDVRINDLSMQAYKAAQDIKEFKLYILSKQLLNKIRINLPPTLINHMLNELSEYLKILNCYTNKQTYSPSVLHHHLLWLSDGAAHANLIASFLDFSEKIKMQESKNYVREFDYLYLKAIEYKGYTRTGLIDFPALTRLSEDVDAKMDSFKAFLEELKNLTTEKKLPGILNPLTADHMYREECYYQTKLSQTAKTKKPDCDPGKPRITD